MILRFILYGLIGLAIEILWTSIYDKLFCHKKEWNLQGTTYVWMFPIYGCLVFLYEPVFNLIKDMEWYYRGAIYSLGFMTAEYIFGYLLRLVSICPWDYSNSKSLHLHGLVRLDYAPLWFAFGLLMEPISKMLSNCTCF